MQSETAFELFVQRVSDRLLRTSFLLVGDRGHAEDLVQLALWRAYQHWDEIGHSPDAYVRKTLLNLSRDHRRLLARRPVEVADLSGVAHSKAVSEPAITRGEVVEAVSALPRRLREVIVFRFYLDLSVEDTAGVLGTSEGAVKAYSSRGLKRLKRWLADADVEGTQ